MFHSVKPGILVNFIKGSLALESVLTRSKVTLNSRAKQRYDDCSYSSCWRI